MMSTYEQRLNDARKIESKIVQGDARLCRPIFGRVCKAIWPYKTAEELAALVGCAVRTAAYEISGEREPSARSIAVIVVEMTKKQ